MRLRACVPWLIVTALTTMTAGCSALGQPNGQPADANRQVLAAAKHYQAGRYADAIAACDAALKNNPQNANAFKQRALARMESADALPATRVAIFQDLIKAVQLSQGRDPTSHYLMFVYHMDDARRYTDDVRVEQLKRAGYAMQEARRLDPQNPHYIKAEEYLRAQAFFARRDAGMTSKYYLGEYADIVRFGDTIPYGELMKQKGVPGPPVGEPRRRGRSGSGDEELNTGMAVAMGIAGLVVVSAIVGHDASPPGRGGPAGGGVEVCATCSGRGRISEYSFGELRWRMCYGCGGSGVRAR